MKRNGEVETEVRVREGRCRKVVCRTNMKRCRRRRGERGRKWYCTETGREEESREKREDRRQKTEERREKRAER